VSGDPAGDGLGAVAVLCRWLAGLGAQVGQKGVGLAEQVLAAYLGANGLVQKFRGQPRASPVT